MLRPRTARSRGSGAGPAGGGWRLSRGKALLIAVPVSFAVQLTPLFSVHAGLTPIGLVFATLAEPSALSLAMAAFAVLLQALAALLLYWVLRGVRWWKGVAVAAAVPFVFVAANWGMLYAVPSLFLIEADSHPELGNLQRVCSVSDTILAQVHSGSDLALVRAGEAWAIRQSDRSWARLTMPGCTLLPVNGPKVGSTMDYVAPGGYLLFRMANGDVGYAAPRQPAPVVLSAPAGVSYWEPVLSDDGGTVGWLDRAPAGRGLGRHRLRLRHMDDGGEETITLDLAPRDQLALVGLDTADGRFTLARYRNDILAVDRRGRVTKGPISPGGVYDARWGFRWLKGGWVAWDGYREEGRARIVWSLPTGHGEREIPLGRAIDSLNIAADGRTIAVSVSTNLNIGRTKSAVIVLRADTGEEIYRRYYPAYTRARLAFLGSNYLAITRPGDPRGQTDVYRVPTSADPGPQSGG